MPPHRVLECTPKSTVGAKRETNGSADRWIPASKTQTTPWVARGRARREASPWLGGFARCRSKPGPALAPLPWSRGPGGRPGERRCKHGPQTATPAPFWHPGMEPRHPSPPRENGPQEDGALASSPSPPVRCRTSAAPRGCPTSGRLATEHDAIARPLSSLEVPCCPARHPTMSAVAPDDRGGHIATFIRRSYRKGGRDGDLPAPYRR